MEKVDEVNGAIQPKVIQENETVTEREDILKTGLYCDVCNVKFYEVSTSMCVVYINMNYISRYTYIYIYIYIYIYGLCATKYKYIIINRYYKIV